MNEIDGRRERQTQEGGGREGVMKKRRRRERGRNEAEGRITRQ